MVGKSRNETYQRQHHMITMPKLKLQSSIRATYRDCRPQIYDTCQNAKTCPCPISHLCMPCPQTHYPSITTFLWKSPHAIRHHRNQQLPAAHILTDLTVIPRSFPSPQVGSQSSFATQHVSTVSTHNTIRSHLPFQKSRAANSLSSTHGLAPLPSQNQPFCAPTATFRMR
jgi:hypothetical protein